jgi:ribonuclease HII
VDQIDGDYDRLLIDGNYQYIEGAETIVAGDTTEKSIAAASIIAKVLRDRYMIKMSKIYPGYSWETNVGYGTKKHLLGIDELSINILHRKLFV